jgi:hypothetical protein
MKYFTTILAIAMLLSGCNSGNTAKKQSTDMGTATVPQPETNFGIEPKQTEVTTKTGKFILIKETHPNGMSLTDIEISFKDDSTTLMKLTDKDPVFKTFVSDLDNNGYDEVYIITVAAGSGSYGNVHGFASNKDKSFSMVYLPEVEEKDMQSGGYFEGYQGHDLFEIMGTQLTRSFPVKEKTKKIIYTLQQTETGYTLKALSANIN